MRVGWVAMLQNNPMHFNPTFSFYMKPSFQFREKPLKVSDINMNRRVGAIAALSLVLLAKDSFFTELAYGFEFLLVAPDQTIEGREWNHWTRTSFIASETTDRVRVMGATTNSSPEELAVVEAGHLYHYSTKTWK